MLSLVFLLVKVVTVLSFSAFFLGKKELSFLILLILQHYMDKMVTYLAFYLQIITRKNKSYTKELFMIKVAIKFRGILGTLCFGIKKHSFHFFPSKMNKSRILLLKVSMWLESVITQ